MAYATATAKAYCNTGFSAANTPASPSVLQSAAGSVVDIGTINILPILGQAAGTIEVPAFEAISECDYIAINQANFANIRNITTYWLVQGYSYVTADTLSISIVLDAFLTIGGVPGISKISGLVQRHTTKTDEYGAYDQADPMLTPAEPLIIRAKSDMKPQTGYYTIILASFHLGRFGSLDPAQMGLTYGPTEQNVTCPNIPPLTNDTFTEIQCASAVYKLPAIAAFDAANEDVRTGISRARSIGVESGIIAQYLLPQSLFSITKGSDGIISKIASGTNETGLSGGPDCQNMPYLYKAVNNKRVLYGDYNTVKIVSTATGEQTEYDPAHIKMGGSGTGGAHDYPIFKVFSDGRAHGKPYCYPLVYRGMTQEINNLSTFISGMEWQAAPLTYDYASGAGMSSMFFRQQTIVDSMNMGETMGTAAAQQFGRNIVGAITGSGTAGGYYAANQMGKQKGYEQLSMFDPPKTPMLTQSLITAASQIVGGYSSIMMGIGDSLRNFEVAADVYNRSRNLEEAKLLTANYAVAPEIAFPASESIRDFVGNMFRAYQITPSDSDLVRMDRILNMYGYQDVGAALSVDDLSAGNYYTYVQAGNVEITTVIPFAKWLKELVYQQFSSGIRIWKQKPDFSLYDQNNRA